MAVNPSSSSADQPPATGVARALTAKQRRQVVGLTVAALLLFVVVRNLPVGSDLNHMDFRVAGPNVIPFCDPANPAFIPVVAVRSPVELKVSTPGAAIAGQPQELRLDLTTASGKAIGPGDLQESHTRKLHLLVVDPSLRDYQHLHPEPARDATGWRTEFTPRFGGVYRVFADFVPTATGRGLYAFADLTVSGPAADPRAGSEPSRLVTEKAGHRFTFSLQPAVVVAGKRAELQFSIEPLTADAVVPLEPVMGAYAHVVAFDDARSGFAHLHPVAGNPLAPPDAQQPRLSFTIEIPRGGNYVLWAQVKLAGVEQFIPFRLQVAP